MGGHDLYAACSAIQTYANFHNSELNVNSAIAKPAHGETLFIPYEHSSKEIVSGDTYAVRGFAYAGGGRRISRVELSLDDGHTWTLADMCVPSGKAHEPFLTIPLAEIILKTNFVKSPLNTPCTV